MTALDPGQLSYRPIERWLCLPIASTIVTVGVTKGMTRVWGLWWDDRGWKLDVVTVSTLLWWSMPPRAR